MSFVRDKSREDLDRDRLLVRGVLHAILEIGEAAANLSEASRARVPRVPWDDVAKMRNVLVHVCWGVKHDKVWETLRHDLPELVKSVESALAHWPLKLE